MLPMLPAPGPTVLPLRRCDAREPECVQGAPCASDDDCIDADVCTVDERCDLASKVCLFSTLDGDGDGHPPAVCGGDDTNDDNPDAFPGAREACNLQDDDADGRFDEMACGEDDGTPLRRFCRAWGCDHAGYLKPPEGAVDGGRFGYSIAASGDNAVICATDHVYAVHLGPDGPVPVADVAMTVDSISSLHCAMDGTTIVVGNEDQGRAFVYSLGQDSLTEAQSLTTVHNVPLDRFGSAVAVRGDLLFVGASHEDSAATGVGGDESDDTAEDTGAAFVFTRSNGTWAQSAYLKPPHPPWVGTSGRRCSSTARRPSSCV